MYRFQYKVYYPHITTDLSSSNEHLLRHFWRHTQNYFFKKIQLEEINRLHCLKAIFHQNTKNPLICFNAPSQFWNDIQNTFNPKYLNSAANALEIDKNTQNWLKTLYVLWQILETKDPQNKKQLKTKYDKLKECRQLLSSLYKNKKKQDANLRKENAILQTLIEYQTSQSMDEQQQQDEITHMIAQLQDELSQNQRNTQPLIDGLYDAVVNNKPKDGLQQTKFRKNLNRGKNVDIQVQLSLKNNLNCIAMIINNLEQRQIAESINKTLFRNKNPFGTEYCVCFEPAINLQHQLISESKLMKMNNYRENMLLKFYKTGLKSPYSFISSNYYGFNQVCRDRYNLGRFRDKDLLPLMKKSPINTASTDVMNDFNNFNMCHHCKYLYPNFLLITCKFQSARQAIPKSNAQNSEQPDFSQIMTEDIEKAHSSQRFMARRKNCLTSYCKINDEFVCGRQYCLSCLHQTYPHDGMLQKGICPFCKGICTCSRCLRREHIMKFKNLYVILGGDLNQVQSNYLDTLEQKEQVNLQKSRGRPRKIKNNTHMILHKVHKKIKCHKLHHSKYQRPKLRQPLQPSHEFANKSYPYTKLTKMQARGQNSIIIRRGKYC